MGMVINPQGIMESLGLGPKAVNQDLLPYLTAVSTPQECDL